MSHIKFWLFQIVRGLILLFSLLCILQSIYLIVAIAFNLPTTFKTGPGSHWSIAQYEVGMPIKASFWVHIPDSSVVYKYANGGGGYAWYPGPNKFPPFKDDRIPLESHMIRVKYDQGEEFDKSIKPLNIATVELNEATVFVRPKNLLQKFLFGLPPTLYILMLGLIGFQIFRLLTSIYSKRFFEKRNYLRLASIGWMMIGYNIIVYVLESIQQRSQWVMASFESTIPDYRMPFQLSGSLQSSVSFQMLILGLIILAFASAFRIGYHLQKDQRLTV